MSAASEPTSLIPSADRDILRQLAQRWRELADAPEMAERRKLWKQHNALESDRPMVLCFPEGSWREIHATRLPLACTSPAAQALERQLRDGIYAAEVIGDDNVLEPAFNVAWDLHDTGYGVDIPKHWGGDGLGSYVWDPPLKDLARDLAKLKPREFYVNRETTHARIALAQSTFGDILPVQLRSDLFWSVGLTQQAARLMGLQELMLAFYDQPRQLEELMAFLRDDFMNYLDFCEREQLITRKNDNAYTGSGGVAYTDELPDAPSDFSGWWGFAESQETVGVSPQHFGEFVLPYQLPLLERFGLNCYGCCEQLESRIDLVLEQVPRLRRVSVAPLANEQALAPELAGRAIFSRKVDPTKVCVGFREDAIREEVRHTLALTEGKNVELILKDTHTVENEPERLANWVRIVREEIDAAFGE